MAISMTVRSVVKKARLFRRAGLVLVMLAAIYAVAGTVLVPYLVRTRLLPLVSRTIGAPLTVAEVRLDPFALVLTVRGLFLRGAAGDPILDVREVSVDVDGIASLREHAAVARASVVEPVLGLKRDARGKLNIAFLMPTDDGRKNPPTAVPFLFQELTLEQGRVEFRDDAVGKPYQVGLGTISLNIEGLGTNREAAFHLSAHGDEQETIAAEGTLGLFPLVSKGHVKIAGMALAPLLNHWLPPNVPEIRAGQAGSSLSYSYGGAGAMDLTLEAGEARVDQLELGARNGPRLRIGSLALNGIEFTMARQRLRVRSATLRDAVASTAEQDSASGRADPPDDPDEAKVPERLRDAHIDSLELLDLEGSLPERSLAIATVVSAGAELDLYRDASGTVGVWGLLAPPLPPPSTGPAETPWKWEVGEIRVNDYSLRVRDTAVEPPVRLRFEPLALRLTDLRSDPGSQFKFRLDTKLGRTGKIEVDGQARREPLQADLRFGIDKFRLRAVQPYWQARTGADLTDGRLNMWGDITILRKSDLSLDYSGGAEIVELAAVARKDRSELIHWRSLKFDGIVFNTQPQRFAVRSVTAEQPYARVTIDQERRLNLARQLVKPTSTEPSASLAWPVVVGALRVADGEMDFSDLSLKPNFALGIHQLNGDIRGLSSQESATAEILLKGKLDQESPVLIRGQIHPFRPATHTDIAMQFRGVNLATLSPYSGKFAGYRIEKGKLDMDLRYRVENRKLTANNRVAFDHLVLGERVESPEATTLPVDLAVALLKDSDGHIDLDIPVTGDLDDPSFSLGGLLGQALTEMLTKLVGSPFAILGSLVGSSGGELGDVKFPPGDASLDPDEKGKLGKMAAALRERPGLNLDIKGSADPEQDRMALAERALLRQLKQARLTELRRAGKPLPDPDAFTLSDGDYQRLATDLYRQRHPEWTEPAKGSGFEPARRRMLDQWGVNELDLRRLAQARGEAIRNYLVQEGGLPEQRIYLLDVKLLQTGGQDIKAFLSLSGS